MAATSGGIEFHLLEVFVEDGSASIEEVQKIFQAGIRDGDAAFLDSKRLYVAFVGDVRGTAKACRRMIEVTKKNGVTTRYRLVVEPFPEELGKIASKVITGEVKVDRRADPPEEPETKYLD